MPHRTPDQISRRGAPRAVQDPREPDEGEREVRCSDGDESEEGDGRCWVPSGPEVDRHECERRGEEGEVDEWGECLGTVASRGFVAMGEEVGTYEEHYG